MLPLVKPRRTFCPNCGQEIRDIADCPKYCNNMISVLDPATGREINRYRCGAYIWDIIKGRIQTANIKNTTANVGVKAGGGLLFIVVLCTVLIPALVYGIKSSEGAQSCGGVLIIMLVGFGFLLASIGGPLFAAKKATGGILGMLRSLFK